MSAPAPSASHPSRPDIEHADAVIIGSGPSGSAAGAALAIHGRKVITLEKSHFPRYHIGESLIPYCWFPLNRIGMLDKLKASHFVRKHSVQFVSTTGRQSHPFYFTKHTNHDCASTWQVLRSEFDTMLAANAAEKGADVRFGVTVRELIEQDGRILGVRAVDESGREFEVHAPVTIDASGRDNHSMNRYGWRIMDRKLKKIAIWTYFKGAKRDAGIDEGATTVAYLPDKGWFWYIPQHDDMISVGVVAEREYLYRGERDPKAIFHREAALQPWITDHIAQGTQTGEYRVTSDYSYRSKHCAMDGLVLIGDAFNFLDPVFSSGVFLALHTGVLAADAVNDGLSAADTSAERFTEYGVKANTAIEAMRRLVYAFYDHNFNFGDFFRKYPNLHSDLTDCLIGNLHKDFDPLFDAVAEFADVPEPLPHGLPLTKTPVTTA